MLRDSLATERSNTHTRSPSLSLPPLLSTRPTDLLSIYLCFSIVVREALPYDFTNEENKIPARIHSFHLKVIAIEAVAIGNSEETS